MKTLIIKNIQSEGPGLLEDYLKEAKIDYQIVELWQGQECPPLERFTAVVILGGPMGVYEEEKYPHLVVEDKIIKEIVAKKISYLGICLGAQLLAKAVGGKVTKNPAKEIGHYQIKLTEAGKKDKLFQGFEEVIPVFQWHEDTFSIPDGAIKLAQSDLCANQAFRFGENAYALQFHLETTREMVEDWIKGSYQELASENINPENLIDEFESKADKYRELAYLMFSNFFA